jgi:integrase
VSILRGAVRSVRFIVESDLQAKDNRHMESQPPAFGSLVQNFFIVLPHAGSATNVTPGSQTETVLNAIRAALGTALPQGQITPAPTTFEDVAWEWYQNKAAAWAPSYAGRLKSRLEGGLLAHLGAQSIANVSPQDALEVIRKAEARDVRETARRILRIASAVFRYAVATGRCAQDPTVALKGALKSPRAVKHRATLSARDLPKFLRSLEMYQGDLTRLAMELVLLTFVRTAELRFAKWSEFEGLEAPDPIWRIPAERMKMRRAHLVPLPKQAVCVLRKIRGLALGSDYVFPANTKLGVISENTLLFALYRMGYRKRASVHGFRSLASTILNEAQFNRDWIEMQLAHADNSVRGVYNAAEWFSGRRTMLQWWADYVDTRRVS